MRSHVFSLALVVFASLCAQIRAEERVLFDFEQPTLEGWTLEGDAFKDSPVVGGHLRLLGFRGDRLLNSFYKGDDARGVATSPEFELTEDFVSLLVGGGDRPNDVFVELLVADEPVRSASGTNSGELHWRSWDVRDLRGKQVRLRVTDRAEGPWGHLNVDQVHLTDKRRNGSGVWRLDEYRRSPQYYQERYRPKFHFTPELNWMNDPNGMVFHEGEYHLFYQHNPLGIDWGHMSWGHAVSKDLVHWEHLPIALRDEYGVMIFSGSAVVDHENTSGFGENGRAPLVAIYTGHMNGRQTQDIAYSNDRGRTWIKYSENPVIDLGDADFRDPKVFWHPETKQWVMVVALSAKKTVHFYGSPNLKDWTFLSEFGPAGVSPKANWECPDLFQLPVANVPGETRWLLEANMGGGGPSGGSGGEYFLGSFDGQRFVPESMESQWIEHGKDFYAEASWSDIPAEDGRRIWMGWLANTETIGAVPTHPWRGAMSVPRELTLRRFDDGLRLCQAPVRELQTLRDEAIDLRDIELRDEAKPLDLRGEQLEFIVEFTPDDAREFGLKVRTGGEQETVVGYDTAKKELFVDRTRSGESAFHGKFAGRHSGPLAVDANRHVRLHVLVDSCSVEVFGNDGEMVLTELIFPDPESDGVSLFATGGACHVSRCQGWKLKSAILPPPGEAAVVRPAVSYNSR